MLALVGGLVFTSIALGQANAKTKLSDALYEFITINLLEQANPDIHDESDPTIRMVLDRANEELDDQFKDDPEIELKLRETIRSAYKSLGAYEQAKAQSEQMIAIAEPLYGREDNRTLRKMHGLSTDLLDLSRFEDALEICLEVYEIRKQKLGINHLETLQIMNNLGACHMRLGNFKDAAIVLEDALEGKEIVLGVEDLSTINTRHNLGSLKLSMGQYDDAERLLKVVIEQRVAQLGSSHPRVTRSRSVLAATYFLRGEYEKCLEITDFAIKSIGDRLEPNHPMRLNLELTSIRALSGIGNHKEAWRRAKEHEASFKSEGNLYPEWLHRSAAIAHRAGDTQAAVQLYEEYIDYHYDENQIAEECEFYIDFASALESTGDIQRSIDALKHAIETLSNSQGDIKKRKELLKKIDYLGNQIDVQDS
ncbi:MAG: tetratricopeptide repeat protein [Phycisphaerales bacterium]